MWSSMIVTVTRSRSVEEEVVRVDSASLTVYIMYCYCLLFPDIPMYREIPFTL